MSKACKVCHDVVIQNKDVVCDACNAIIEEAYRQGYEAALKDYSIWKDGIQVIGCMQLPVKDIIAENRKDPVPYMSLDF